MTSMTVVQLIAAAQTLTLEEQRVLNTSLVAMINSNRKIKAAMTYPIIMVVGMVGCTAILMVKVIPTLTSFFGDPEKLPTATKYIMAVSDFFTNSWFLMLV